MTASILVISDLGKLFEIEAAWNAFMNKCSRNPFALSGFVKQFMEFNRSKGWNPLILVISVENKIVGVAPLRMRKKLGVRIVKFLFKPWLSPDFIFDDQYREICMDHTLDFIFKNLGCHRVDLTMPAESPNLRILEQKCKSNRIHFYTRPAGGHRIISVERTWDEFEESRGGRFRREFKHIERKLDRAGSWRTLRVENWNKGSDTIRKILDVERMSWKESRRARIGLEKDEDLLMIWEGSQYTAGIEPNLKPSVWFLELNNQTLAYSLVLEYREMAFIVKTSYDERYKGFYPGIYVNNAAIRELFNRGLVKSIDLLTDIPFQRTWTSNSLPKVSVTMTRRSVLGTKMRLMLACVRIPFSYLRSGLERAKWNKRRHFRRETKSTKES